MPETARRHYQRARRDEEKIERRRGILAAADALLRTTGFEGFSMAALAQKAGVAKATLYLYFSTREEVLLALYVATLTRWGASLLVGLRTGMSDDEFAELFQATSLADPNFMTLRARLESVIEHNVSIEQLVAAKRSMQDVLHEVAPRVEQALGLPEGRGGPLLVSLGALHLGAEQANTSPAVDGLDLPPDVEEFMRLHREFDVFRANAAAIVANMREGG